MKRTRLRAKRPGTRRTVHPVQPAHRLGDGSVKRAEYRVGVDLRRLAAGRECQVRIPGICNSNAETTVLAHYRLAPFSGIGIKPADWLGSWACSRCHTAIDFGNIVHDYTRDAIRRMHAEGVFRTLAKLIEEGYIVVSASDG